MESSKLDKIFAGMIIAIVVIFTFAFMVKGQDKLYIEEIDCWDAYIYKLQDTVDVPISDTLEIGDNFIFQFEQPMQESDYDDQPDPNTFSIDTLWKPIHLQFDIWQADSSIVSGGVGYITYNAGTFSFIEGKYGLTIACTDTAGNQSKFCDWKPFFVRSIKWVPFIPIKIMIETKARKE